MICFDIETGPLSDDVVMASYNPDDVKLGNLKDEAKIEAKLKEAAEKHRERAALSAVTGQVLAIGWMLYRDQELVYESSWQKKDRDERSLLKMFWATMKAYPREHFVGFYSNTFDIPFLFRRSLILGVDVPNDMFSGRYLSPRFLDLLDIWQCGDRQASVKLGDLDQAMGGPGKMDDVTGVDFARLFNGTKKEREQALEYLRMDVEATWRVAERFGVL